MQKYFKVFRPLMKCVQPHNLFRGGPRNFKNECVKCFYIFMPQCGVVLQQLLLFPFPMFFEFDFQIHIWDHQQPYWCSTCLMIVVCNKAKSHMARNQRRGVRLVHLCINPPLILINKLTYGILAHPDVFWNVCSDRKASLVSKFDAEYFCQLSTYGVFLVSFIGWKD